MSIYYLLFTPKGYLKGELIKSSLHNSIGLVYAQQDDIDQAYIHFSKALKNSLLPLHIACVHHNLALIS